MCLIIWLYYKMAPFLSVCPVQARESSTECLRNFKFGRNIVSCASNWPPIFGLKGQGQTAQLKFRIDADSAAPCRYWQSAVSTLQQHCHLANKYEDVVCWWTIASETRRGSAISHREGYRPISCPLTPPQNFLFSINRQRESATPAH